MVDSRDRGIGLALGLVVVIVLGCGLFLAFFGFSQRTPASVARIPKALQPTSAATLARLDHLAKALAQKHKQYLDENYQLGFLILIPDNPESGDRQLCFFDTESSGILRATPGLIESTFLNDYQLFTLRFSIINIEAKDLDGTGQFEKIDVPDVAIARVARQPTPTGVTRTIGGREYALSVELLDEDLLKWGNVMEWEMVLGWREIGKGEGAK